MTVYELMEDKIRYNQWANSRVVAWLKEQAHSSLYEKVDSSFPNLNKLLHHMMEAQTYYLSILTGEKGDYQNDLSNEQVFEQLLNVDQELLSWFLEQPTEIVAKVLALKRSPHEERYSVATLITHIVNHGTYHRGQIIALRQPLGFSAPPKTDYYWMFAEQILASQKL